MAMDIEAGHARAEVRQYARGGAFWGAWLVCYLPPTVLALYAWSRDEVNGMLLAWVVVLAISLWQVIWAVRSNRALDRLLSRYESACGDIATVASGTGERV